MRQPTFHEDQYTILKKKDIQVSLKRMDSIIQADSSLDDAFEKVWIPEQQVLGEVRKINKCSFEKVHALYDTELKQFISAHTSLNDLELVAVRRNILRAEDSVNMHADTSGYVVIIHIPEPTEEQDQGERSGFRGGQLLFTKDNGEVVEIDLQRDEVLIAKCTNAHGVKPVTSGIRETISLFSRPSPSAS